MLIYDENDLTSATVYTFVIIQYGTLNIIKKMKMRENWKTRGDFFEIQLSFGTSNHWVAIEQVKFEPDQLVWNSHRQSIYPYFLISH